LWQTGRKHMVHPQPEGQESIRYLRKHYCRISKDRTATVGFNDRGHKTERRNEDDVHLRVPEEPEHMLIEKRVSALGWVHEVCRDGAVIEQQDRASDHDGGHGEDNHEGLD